MDVALLVFLILLNGGFAMSEMALTASRKAPGGDGRKRRPPRPRGAGPARQPDQVSLVVQIGITSIGVLNGIVGDAAFSEPLAAWLQATLHISTRAAAVSATALVVVLITMLTIVFGELVPKRLGQMYPEAVARTVAEPMEWMSWIARPLVKLLSWSTDATLRLLGLHRGPVRSVTEEEIAASLEEGASTRA